MLREGGSLVVFGLSSVARRNLGARLGVLGSLATLAWFAALPGNLTRVFAIDRAYYDAPARVTTWVGRVVRLLADGAISPIVAATLPLARAREGHALVETGAAFGKVVLDCR